MSIIPWKDLKDNPFTKAMRNVLMKLGISLTEKLKDH